jgi:hypothetical protein
MTPVLALGAKILHQKKIPTTSHTAEETRANRPELQNQATHLSVVSPRTSDFCGAEVETLRNL